MYFQKLCTSSWEELDSRPWRSHTLYFYLKNGTVALRCDLLGRRTVTVINRDLFLLDTSIVIASHRRNIKS